MAGYNLKLTQFKNGQVEVIHYGKGVRTPLDEEQSYLADVKSARDSNYSRFKERMAERVQYVECPFTGELVKEYSISDALYEQRKAERSACGSLNRTRNALYQLSRQVEWEYFITLTFSPDAVNRYDFNACMCKARTWVNHLRYDHARDLVYVLVPEQHKDGAWHIHGLLSNCGDISFVDSGTRSKKQIVYNLSDWRYGYSTATAVRDTCKVSYYLTKYITKDLCSVTKGKRRYYASQNIPKPVVYTWLIEPNEVVNFVQTVADSLGADLQYEKEIGGYLDVSYKYYKVEKENKVNE